MLNAYFIGAVGAIAALACEFAVDYVLPLGGMTSLDTAASKALFIAGIPEEGIKFFLLVYLAEKHVDVRRLQDILVLALAVSLGFATLENFFYVISAGDWKLTAAVRAITSVPGHGLDGLAMGRPADCRAHARAIETGLIKYVLIVPVILHAFYDFPLFAIEKGIATTRPARRENRQSRERANAPRPSCTRACISGPGPSPLRLPRRPTPI